MSRPPATQCFAAACARCATSQSCKSHGWHKGSWPCPHEIHENFLQGAFSGLEVLEVDPEFTELFQQESDPRPFALRIEGVDQFISISGQLERVGGEFIGNAFELVLQVQNQLPLAELLH